MNTSNRDVRSHSRSIDDEISDLSEEYVCGAEAKLAIALILVAVNDPASSIIRAGLNDRKTVRISSDLSIVIIYDWRRDNICATWEIDGSRSCGC
jgi:hypothetical protein